MKLRNLSVTKKCRLYYLFPTALTFIALSKKNKRNHTRKALTADNFISCQVKEILEREDIRRRQLDDKAKNILQGNLTITVLTTIPLQLPSEKIGALPSFLFILGILYLLFSIFSSFQALKPTQIHMITLDEVINFKVAESNLVEHMYNNIKQNEKSLITKSNFIDASTIETIYAVIFIALSSIAHLLSIGTLPIVIELRSSECSLWAISLF